jgi:hypothetical protein
MVVEWCRGWTHSLPRRPTDRLGDSVSGTPVPRHRLPAVVELGQVLVVSAALCRVPDYSAQTGNAGGCPGILGP